MCGMGMRHIVERRACYPSTGMKNTENRAVENGNAVFYVKCVDCACGTSWSGALATLLQVF
jgi:hypothetical protein